MGVKSNSFASRMFQTGTDLPVPFPACYGNWNRLLFLCVNYVGVYYGHKMLIESLMEIMLANEKLLNTCCFSLGIAEATTQQEIICPIPALHFYLVITSCC